MTSTTHDTLLTVGQAAKYLTLSHFTLNDWRTQGVGPRFVKLGKSVRYKRRDLDAWIEERTTDTTAPR